MSDPADDCVLFSLEDRIARITLNRPARKNAINAAVHAGLRRALDRIEQDERNERIRIVLLTGAGDAFCSGQDLAERAGMLKTGPVDLEQSVRDLYNPLIRRLSALPMPLIAAVNGVAAGAGAALALTADLVLAARSARFQLAFARVALGPDCGISWLLPRLVGQARALGMGLTAEPIDAARAEQWGLIWRVVDDSSLSVEADALAHQLAEGSQPALRTIKQRVRASATETLDATLTAESITQGQLGHGADYREAVDAFMSKRKPRFA